MDKIIHNIITNLENNLLTTPPIEIHQGDSCIHVLRFHLCTNKSPFYSIDKDSKFVIEFFREDKLIISEDVVVDNYARGTLSYVITDNLTKTPGRYTTYLKMIGRDCDNDEVILNKVSFVVTVVKSHDFDPESTEVVLTKNEYDKLIKHLEDLNIHINSQDRSFLNALNTKTTELVNLVEDYDSWIKFDGYVGTSKIDKLSDIPLGKVIVVESLTLKDYSGESHYIEEPSFIFHSYGSEVDTHRISIFSSNDIVHYEESGNSSSWTSLKDFNSQILGEAKKYTDTRISESLQWNIL